MAAAANPAQAKTLSSLAAPKSTNLPTNKLSDQEPSDAVIAADETSATIEMIEPSTGEIIVLAQHKPATPAKAEEQVTPLAKPEKRTKGRAKLKTKPAEDGTTPDTTATAKSEAGARTGAKSAEVLAANAARKERKAAEKAKAAAKAKPARGEAKAGKGGSKAKKAR